MSVETHPHDVLINVRKEFDMKYRRRGGDSLIRPCAHGYWYGHCPVCTGAAWGAATLRECPDVVTSRGQVRET